MPLVIEKSLSSVSPVVATVRPVEVPDDVVSAIEADWPAVIAIATSVTVIAVAWAFRGLVPSVKARVMS